MALDPKLRPLVVALASRLLLGVGGLLALLIVAATLGFAWRLFILAAGL